MADNIVYIDVSEGSKRVMNNTKLYAKLLAKFIDDKSAVQFETALADEDNEAARSAAHAVKGLAANLSLIELFNKSLEVETSIKSNTLKADQITNFKNVYTKTIEEIGKVIAQYA
ncbi:MAG: Hpt domain-containing protein [Treponema sp.]|nr:Hpt domain-containing protein [Treponema sp.]